METYRPISPLHFLAAALVCLISLGLSSQNKLDWLISPVTTVTTPLRRPLLSLRFQIDQGIGALRQLPTQYRLTRDLERRLAELSVTAQKVKTLEQENEVLRNTLKAPAAANHRLLPAQILSLARNAVIDVGSQNGVKAGQAVIVADIYLGKIISVTPHAAKVQLLNDPDTDLAATTLSGALGTVNVQNSQIYLSQVLQKDPLKAEEPVFTRGLDIPNQLLIGTTKKVNNNPADVYKTAVLTPAARINDQNVVLVVLE